MSRGLQDAGEDWPDPVTVLNEDGRSDIVLLCEHASRHIPAEYGGLGLPDSELARHIAWDIGAEGVARGLARRVDAACFIGNYSRLLIDLNRPLSSPNCIPTRSESTDVPGNIAMSETERQRRISRMFVPYHERVRGFLDQRDRAGRTTVLVTIHSFTPVFMGKARPWHAGVLFDRSRDFASDVIDRLAADPTLTIGANEPYIIDRNEDYAVPVHGEDRGYPAILIEIRQDLVGSEAGIAEWTERLTAALQIA